jgi:hypothetical protein
VYGVVSLDGQHLYEAQAFEHCPLPEKLYLARKRRIKRLQRSKNIIDEFEQNEAKILVSRISGGGLERHRKSEECRARDCSRENKPSRCGSEQVWSKASIRDCRCVTGWEAAPTCSESSSTRSCCPPEYLSKSRKGSKQREKRRERRDTKRNLAVL